MGAGGVWAFALMNGDPGGMIKWAEVLCKRPEIYAASSSGVVSSQALRDQPSNGKLGFESGEQELGRHGSRSWSCLPLGVRLRVVWVGRDLTRSCRTIRSEVAGLANVTPSRGKRR